MNPLQYLKTAIFFNFMFSLCISAQENTGFNNENWDIFGGRTDTIGGREAFSGAALLKDVQFSDGTIEWDLWATGARSYAGVIFRFQTNRDAEEFYVRPHKVNGLNADAMQYTPVFHGVSCWQLYHGEGCTGALVMPLDKWVHFKLSVKGEQAVLSIDNMAKTRMLISRLELGELAGRIGVKGPADGSAWFSNFTWSPETDIEFPETRLTHSPAPGIIESWEISQAITNDRVDPYRYYKDMEGIQWSNAKAGKDGLVNLTREVIRNPIQPGWLYARTRIISESEKLSKFQLGYSDYVTVFVNGKPIMSSTNAYTSRDPGFAGLTGYFDEVFLPLKEGENEICLLIGEQFGGWGFMMRDGEAIRKAAGISKVWELKHKLSYPESVVYDPDTDMLYVSNNLNSTGGGISRVSTEGQIKDLDWVSGLASPTGISIFGNSVFVVERKAVAEIDKITGVILNRIELEGSIFPNDIAISDKGSLYVSDNASNRIYSVENGSSSIWMEGGELQRPNGIEIRGGDIYVACSGDCRIKKIDISTKEVSTIASLPEGSIMDGLQVLDNGNLLCSDFNGHLFHIDGQGNTTEILNTVSTQVNLADFEYIESKQMLVIPGLYSNVLSGISLKNFLKAVNQ